MVRKNESRDQKRRRKLAERQGKRMESNVRSLGAGERVAEYQARVDPADPDFLLVRIRQPDGGKMPTSNYEGQQALDRFRRYIIGSSLGRVGRRPTDAEKAWLDLSAHGNPEGVSWRQQSTSDGAIIEIRFRKVEGARIGTAGSDEESTRQKYEFMALVWPVLDLLEPDEVARRLALAPVNQKEPTRVVSAGWAFLFSCKGDGKGRLCVFSAQLVPVGRGSLDEDWKYLGAVMARVGVPPKAEQCAVWTDLGADDLDCNGVLLFVWSFD
jgi:hypothetical protein